ncbi:MAG TPA: hypothetical protein VI685_00890 [Candidatus Angelobacter sp.]
MRRFFLAGSVFVLLFLAIFLFTSCGGGSSSQTTPSASSGGGSTPAAASTVIDNIQEQTWLTCGACGNNGGTGPVANYSATLGIVSPSEDGAATQFAIAAAVPFTNGYFYQHHNSVTGQFALLTYEFDLFVPTGFENAPQAIEFECQQRLGGWIYSFAWQANYAGGSWRIYNYGSKKWEESGLTLQRFSPGTWHHVMAEFHNDGSSHSVFHDALTVDGVRTPINIRHDAFAESGSDQFSNAFQLDSNSLPNPYSVFVDKMKITYK